MEKNKRNRAKGYFICLHFVRNFCTMSCYVISCKNTKKDMKKGVVFFRMGKNKYTEWMKALRRPIFGPPSYYHQVCSEHFTPDCIITNGNKKILKSGSVPTLKLRVRDYYYNNSNSQPIQHTTNTENNIQDKIASVFIVTDENEDTENCENEGETKVMENCENEGISDNANYENKEDMEEEGSVPNLFTINTFHTYSKTPEDDKISKLRKHMRVYKKQLKCATARANRRKYKIVNQRQTIIELKKQLAMSSKIINSLERKLLYLTKNTHLNKKTFKTWTS